MATTYITMANLTQYDSKIKQYVAQEYYNKTEVDVLLEEIRESTSGIDKFVNDLVYYYTKSETYTRDEIMSLIRDVSQFKIIVVDELPTQDINLAAFYLLKSSSGGENEYTEYVYTEDEGWIQLGKQTIDLSNYYTKDEVDEKIPTKVSELENDAGYITAEEAASSAVTGVKGGAERNYRTGNVNLTKADIGLSLVENKSSALIRSEISTANVVSALGFMPVSENTWIPNSVEQAGYVEAGRGNSNKVWSTDENGVPAWREGGSGNVTGVKGSAELGYRIGNVSISPADIGLEKVENKSSATIRSEITAENVKNGLGYTPISEDGKGQPYGVATLDGDGKVVSSQLPEITVDNTLGNLADVDLNNVLDSQILAYDENLGKFVNIGYDVSVGLGVANRVWKTDENGVPAWREESGGQVTGVKGAAETNYRIGDVSISKEDIGLGNVENKSSSDIRNEITSGNVINALGYTPISNTEKGQPNGVAVLGTDGKILSSQIPVSSQVTGVKGSAESSYRIGNVSISKENIGLGNVENKSSSDIRGEITEEDITNALGYTPADQSSSGGNVVYPTKDDFPGVGEKGKTYIAEDTGNSYRWDVSGKTGWTESTVLPVGISNGTCVVYQNEIHVFYAISSSILGHYKWDGLLWEQVDDLSGLSITYNPVAVVFDNKIYLFNASGSNNYSYYWDGVTWNQIASCPIQPHFAVVYDNCIHVFGGANSSYHVIWNGMEWTTTIVTPYYSYLGGAAVVYDNKIHVFYNYTSSQRKHSVWDGSSWSQENDLPVAFNYGCAVVYNNAIHIFANREHYAWNGTEWAEKEGIPSNSKLYAMAIAFNGAIHLMGGQSTASGNKVKDHYQYIEGSYVELSSPNPSIDSISGITVDSPEDGQVMTYNETNQQWENKTPSDGVTALSDLTDVHITSVQNGDVISYDTASSKYINSSRLTDLETIVGEVNAAFNSLFGE